MGIRFFLLLAVLPAICCGQKSDFGIVLDSPFHFIKPGKFYIRDVVDSRSDKSINNFRFNIQGAPEITSNPLTLDSALSLAFMNWLPNDTSLIPVTINIRDFRIIPSPDTIRFRDELKMDIRYQVIQDQQPVDFAFYSFSEGLYKYMKTPVYFARIVREEFPAMIKDLNRYVNSSLDSFAYRGMIIKPAFIADTSGQQDTVFYRYGGKLSWSDFKGLPDSSSIATSVTGAGFSYGTHSAIRDGYLIVSVPIKCFFLSRSSWVQKNRDTKYGLAHEQLHFDIAYLGALKMLNAISYNHFYVRNWEKTLEAINKIVSTETERYQLSYETETKHGKKSKAQLVWQKKIGYLIAENLPGKGGFLPGLIK